MKLHRYQNILLPLILLFSVAAKANTYQFYFVIDVFGCNSCNHLARELRSSPRLLKEGAFLFSTEHITAEQASAYIEDMFGAEFRVVTDKTIYNRILGQRAHFKIPLVAVYDSTAARSVYEFPISDTWYKADVIHYFLDQGKPYHMRKINNKRISRLAGWKNLTKTDDKLFVMAQTVNNRIYMFDLKKQLLDSLYISDEVLVKLYEMNGYGKVDLPKLRRYHSEHDLPMPLISFNSDGHADERYFNTCVYFWYYDPDYKGDTLSPAGNSYFFCYDTRTKELKLQEFDFWEEPTSTDPYHPVKPKYRQDWAYEKFLNDSTWIGSGDKLPDEGNESGKTKLLLKFTRSKKGSGPQYIWRCHGSYDSLYIDSLYTYKGKTMNNPMYSYTSGYKPPYLFYCESPTIKDFEKDKTIHMSRYDKNINWTFDIYFSENLLHVIVQTKQGVFRYTFSRVDYTMLGCETISAFNEGDQLNNQSNLLADKSGLYFLHKSGDIMVFEK